MEMAGSSKNSATGDVRRLPSPVGGLALNFCRNPSCEAFGIPPLISTQSTRGAASSQNGIKATIKFDSNKDKVDLVCGSCGKASVLKNTRAVAEEYVRLKRLASPVNLGHGCRSPGCRNEGVAVEREPGRYRRAGRTGAGVERFSCGGCGGTFSIGSPAGRQKRSNENGLILRLLVNGTPLAKIEEITGVSFRDVYRKIDFIHAQVRKFSTNREALFETIDWQKVGARFATDMQTLTINWPRRRRRALIAVNHLCTAHARTGFIIAGSLQFDPVADMATVEAHMRLSGDFDLPRCHRRQGRLWSRSEFQDYVDRMADQRGAAIVKGETAELQLPHTGALVRQDALQFAHALLLRKFTKKCERNIIVICDSEVDLANAYLSAFADRVRDRRFDLLTIAFKKGASNDARQLAVAIGRAKLAQDLGISMEAVDAIPAHAFATVVDSTIERCLMAHIQTQPLDAILREGFEWPYHTKPEPYSTLKCLTAHSALTTERAARLLRLTTLRSVDSYFHEIRSNLRAATRGGATPSSGNRRWDRYYYYQPEMLSKVVDIYRFVHNWMGSRKTKETPAMKLGLAREKIYERDLFAFDWL